MARILHVTPTYYPATRYGGPIRSVHGLCAALAARGHEVHVFTTSMDGDGNLEVPFERAVRLDGVSVHYFPVPALRRLCWSPRMGRALHREVAGFDVVHLHGVYLWPTIAAASAARRARVPYVLCPRGMLMREVIRRRNRWLKSAWIHLVERPSLTRAAALHVTAEIEAQEASELGLPLPAVFCVPNGVSLPRNLRTLAEGPYRDIARPYALFLSRISWKKGLDRLIAAWTRVPDLDLLIAGNDDEHYRPKLEELVRVHGVGDRVRFLGAVGDEHKWALYGNAECFVLPSYSENFGNVVVEAMAMACPVIVTPEVGVAQFVRDAKAGVVSSNDPELLAAAVRALCQSPAMRRAMGERGQRAVEEQLSWSAVAAQMEKVYRRVAGIRRPTWDAVRST